MKIIRESTVDFSDTTFTGECETCGAVFQVTFPVMRGKNGFLFAKNTEHLVGLKVDHGNFVCLCPECLLAHVSLTECE